MVGVLVRSFILITHLNTYFRLFNLLLIIDFLVKHCEQWSLLGFVCLFIFLTVLHESLLLREIKEADQLNLLCKVMQNYVCIAFNELWVILHFGSMNKIEDGD